MSSFACWPVLRASPDTYQARHMEIPVSVFESYLATD